MSRSRQNCSTIRGSSFALLLQVLRHPLPRLIEPGSPNVSSIFLWWSVIGEISSRSSRRPSRLNQSNDSICTWTRSGISHTVGMRENERRSIPVLERTVCSPPVLAASTPFASIVVNATVKYSSTHPGDGHAEITLRNPTTACGCRLYDWRKS